MKKFYEIGAKTGLSVLEMQKVARFGVFGLIAALTARLPSGRHSAGSPHGPRR